MRSLTPPLRALLLCAAAATSLVLTACDTRPRDRHVELNPIGAAPNASILSVEPGEGPIGGRTRIVIRGENFGGDVEVTFLRDGPLDRGPAATDVSVSSDRTLIFCTTPPVGTAGAVTVYVKTTTNGSIARIGGFRFNQPPTIDRVSPSSGPTDGQTLVTIEGAGFLGRVTVSFGGLFADDVQPNSAGTRLTCRTPMSTWSGPTDVVVSSTTHGRATAARAYSYTIFQTITSVSPGDGPLDGGRAITVDGEGFKGVREVFFGANRATNVVVVSPSRLTCDAPGGVAPGPVSVFVVTVYGTITSSAAFTYNPATVLSSIAPDQGGLAGGTALTIDGQNFGADTTVTIDGNPATDVIVVSPTRVTCVTPASATTGRKDLVVLSGTYGRAVSAGGYRYVRGNWLLVNSSLDGGTTRALAVARSRPAVVYAGAGAAGVFRSTDGGQTWTSANGPESVAGSLPVPMTVTALAIDPAAEDTVFAGAEDGPGPFRSTVGGTTWSLCNSGLPTDRVTLTIVEIVVDPGTPSTVYLLERELGVYRSIDGGDSWSARGSGLPSGAGVAFSSLAIDRLSPATLYCGLADSIGGFLYKSTNGGASWIRSDVGLSAGGVSSVAVCPGDSSQVLAGTAQAGLFGSVDGGLSWTSLYSGTLPESSIRCVLYDPSTPSTAFVGCHRGSAGIYRSLDSGSTWTAAGSGLAGDSVGRLAIDPTLTTSLLAGTSSGVFGTTNQGASWTLQSDGIKALRIRNVAVYPRNGNIVFVATEEAGVYQSTDRGVSWSARRAGLTPSLMGASSSTPTVLTIDAVSPAIMYTSLRGNMFKTSNFGLTWAALGQTGAALVVDPTDSNSLYIGGQGGILKSRDQGATFSPANAGLPGSADVVALAIDTAGNGLYTVVRSAGVYRSTDWAASWETVSSGLPANVGGPVAVDPRDVNTVYVDGFHRSRDQALTWAAAIAGFPTGFVLDGLAFDVRTNGSLYVTLTAPQAPSEIYKSPDRGSRWTDALPLPSRRVPTSIAVDPTNSSIVYVGTGDGCLYRSTTAAE
ncbi:MAG: IPT/TIG domain-containing protein [Candidatus Riflebacteria bacterium]|nr:IPT/TIG domain-containing protein [Candidatus Riflebacteria bacterium]